MTVGKIENGLESGFVKHRLNYLLITDPRSLVDNRQDAWILCIVLALKNHPKLINFEYLYNGQETHICKVVK